MIKKVNGKHLTQNEFDRTMAPIALDMESYFEILHEESQKLIKKAVKEGIPIEELIYQIRSLV